MSTPKRRKRGGKKGKGPALPAAPLPPLPSPLDLPDVGVSMKLWKVLRAYDREEDGATAVQCLSQGLKEIIHQGAKAEALHALLFHRVFLCDNPHYAHAVTWPGLAKGSSSRLVEAFSKVVTELGMWKYTIGALLDLAFTPFNPTLSTGATKEPTQCAYAPYPDVVVAERTKEGCRPTPVRRFRPEATVESIMLSLQGAVTADQRHLSALVALSCSACDVPWPTSFEAVCALHTLLASLPSMVDFTTLVLKSPRGVAWQSRYAEAEQTAIRNTIATLGDAAAFTLATERLDTAQGLKILLMPDMIVSHVRHHVWKAKVFQSGPTAAVVSSLLRTAAVIAGKDPQAAQLVLAEVATRLAPPSKPVIDAAGYDETAALLKEAFEALKWNHHVPDLDQRLISAIVNTITTDRLDDPSFKLQVVGAFLSAPDHLLAALFTMAKSCSIMVPCVSRVLVLLKDFFPLLRTITPTTIALSASAHHTMLSEIIRHDVLPLDVLASCIPSPSLGFLSRLDQYLPLLQSLDPTRLSLSALTRAVDVAVFITDSRWFIHHFSNNTNSALQAGLPLLKEAAARGIATRHGWGWVGVEAVRAASGDAPGSFALPSELVHAFPASIELLTVAAIHPSLDRWVASWFEPHSKGKRRRSAPPQPLKTSDLPALLWTLCRALCVVLPTIGDSGLRTLVRTTLPAILPALSTDPVVALPRLLVRCLRLLGTEGSRKHLYHPDALCDLSILDFCDVIDTSGEFRELAAEYMAPGVNRAARAFTSALLEAVQVEDTDDAQDATAVAVTELTVLILDDEVDEDLRVLCTLCFQGMVAGAPHPVHGHITECLEALTASSSLPSESHGVVEGLLNKLTSPGDEVEAMLVDGEACEGTIDGVGGIEPGSDDDDSDSTGHQSPTPEVQPQ